MGGGCLDEDKGVQNPGPPGQFLGNGSIAFGLFQTSCRLSDNGIDRDLADSDDERGCPKTNRVLDELLPDPDTDEDQTL